MSEADELRAKLDRLVEAVLYTTELYDESRLRYTVKGKVRPNLSIGFETRYQAMYDLALSYREGPTDGQGDDSEHGV